MGPTKRQARKWLLTEGRREWAGYKEIEEASSFIETSLPPSQAEAKKNLLGRLWKGHRAPQCLKSAQERQGDTVILGMGLIWHTGGGGGTGVINHPQTIVCCHQGLKNIYMHLQSLNQDPGTKKRGMVTS